MEIKTYLEEQRRLVDAYLHHCMPAAEGDFQTVITAMRYSLFMPGKRVRPILCLAAARTVCSDAEIDNRTLPVACAMECIHTYSLIHDDLPAMDDDDLRRGHPTCHKQFDEALAILAGDALLTHAFTLLSQPSDDPIPARDRLRIIRIIAESSGYAGMVGGQSLDIINEGREISFELLKTIHASKTGALIVAAVQTGGIAGNATATQLQALKEYGRCIGLGFQIVDDLLDVESTTEQLGKTAGSDVRRGKVTYPSLFGVEESHRLAAEAIDQAMAALDMFDDAADPLRQLARYIIERKR